MQATTAKLRPISQQNGRGDVTNLPQELQEPSEAFPYLEKIGMVAKKNPYAMLTVIVSIASLIVICVTTLSIAIIGGMFVMYGEMKGIRAEQANISKMLDERRNEDKVTRTYTASVLARQDFMVGLMTTQQQTRMNSYDRTNPITPSFGQIRQQGEPPCHRPTSAQSAKRR